MPQVVDPAGLDSNDSLSIARQELILTSELGHEVSALCAIPAAARSVVILSHGFASNMKSSTYSLLERRLNTLGIGSIRYDHYGHGSLYTTPGSSPVAPDITLSKAVASLRAVVSYARSLGSISLALLGSSFGGLVSLVVGGSEDDITALVLKSPVVEPISFWQMRVGDEGISEWQDRGVLVYERHGVRHEIRIDFWNDLQKFDSVSLASTITCPTLIVHGEQDRIVPLSQSELLVGLPGFTLKVIPEADHSYDGPGQLEQFMRYALDFLSSHLPCRTSDH